MKSKLLRLITVFLLLSIALTSCSFGMNNDKETSRNPGSSSSTSESTTSTESSSTVKDPTDDPVEDDPSNSETPTIFLAGDSTVKTYADSQYIAGWGQYLSLFLDSEVNVVNAAQGGRSSRSFINEGRLYNIDDPDFKYTFSENGGKSIEDCIKEGDFLFIQFGHNDDASKISSMHTTIYDRMVPLGEPDENGIYPTTPATKVSTTTLPEEYINAATDAEEASALATLAKYGSEYYAYGSGTYKWYLKQYIDFARSVGAIPVLVTPVARVKFSGNTIIGGAGLHGENFAYVEAVRQLAEEENCLLIDLFAESKLMLETATSTYANYLMALKPNDLTGSWPAGYDNAYGNAEAGYTGIEATHYNKYGAFLQAAKVAEIILNSTDVKANGERFNFSDHILTTPKAYIDPSNLISISTVANLEVLIAKINVSNPNRTYAAPEEVVAMIDALVALGAVTAENHLELQAKCEEIRAKYDALNVDYRHLVTNFASLEQYEADIKAQIDALRPEPVKTVIFKADDLLLTTYDTTVEEQGFTLVGASGKAIQKKPKAVTFSYAGESYTTTYGLSMGGKATFGSNRYVSFTVDGACKVTIATQSSGADARTLLMVDAAGSTVGSYEAGTSVTVSSIDIENAGTYSVGSAGSGIYIYYIIIEYFE